MKTIALRFSDNYAPKEGMIYHHNELLKKYGFVWYGEFGGKVSKDIVREQLNEKEPRFLLIKSGTPDRYWIYYTDFLIDDTPELKYIPSYYRSEASKISCWFKIIKIEKAEKDIMSKCIVISSGDILSNASKHCMNPYFKIEYKGSEFDV